MTFWQSRETNHATESIREVALARARIHQRGWETGTTFSDRGSHRRGETMGHNAHVSIDYVTKVEKIESPNAPIDVDYIAKIRSSEVDILQAA